MTLFTQYMEDRKLRESRSETARWERCTREQLPIKTCFLWGTWKCSAIRKWWCWHNLMKIHNTTNHYNVRAPIWCMSYISIKKMSRYVPTIKLKKKITITDWKFKYPILRLFELHDFPLEPQEFPDEELGLLLSCLSQKYTNTQVLHYSVKDSSSYRSQTHCTKSALCGSPEHQDTNQESILSSMENSL